MGGQPALEASIDIDAPADAVWDKVSDLKAMSKRSPELVRMQLFGAPKPGRRGINLNRRKGFVWPTTSRIVRYKPVDQEGRGALEFHVWPAKVNWSYELEPAEGGTRLTERRTALVDPMLMVRATARFALGGSDAHDVELLDGMNATLRAIKAEAEASN